MKIAIVGTGYVGLVSGACIAEMGHEVICVDIDKTKIDMLQNGEMPIFEKGLKSLVLSNVEGKRLSFSTDIKSAIRESLIVFIAVGTPPDEDGSADLKHVLAVANDIGNYINDYKVVVDKSTVPIGTAEKVKAEIFSQIQKRNLQIDFDVVSNPEFLREGVAIEDFMKPDRIVVGSDSDKASEIMRDLYQSFNFQKDRTIFMSVESAEMTKYAANSLLATKISFMNEIARLCEKVGANVEDVRRGIGSDTRIGYKFLYSGIGYGGSCFPKDVKALIRIARKNEVSSHILDSTEKVNEEQKMVLVDKICQHFGEDLNDKTFALWGLSFKPMTDDMREAPAIVIINELIKRGAKIQAYDPEAMEEARRIFGENSAIKYYEEQYSALDNANALLLITEWHQFRNPNFNKVKELLKEKVVFDGRNQYNPEKSRENGFIYYCIGKQ